MAALGTMAGTLAHDFRGPMTVIRGYAETLLLGNLTPEQIEDRARLIIQTIDRLERMTTETLDFARGGDRLARRTVRLALLLAELAAAVGAEHPGLEVVQEFEIPGDVEARLDVDKVARVLGNIAANAADAMGGRGRLHFAARLEPRGRGRAVCLSLRDEGPGVPESIRDRVFEPFVTAGKKRGTGLGLAVARRFAEDHGGSLELEPDGPGACFRVRLPLGGDHSTPTKPA
jgi:signal transduction histidine kinase